MQINETTQTRRDFTATSGDATFAARHYEGMVTVSVSGLTSASATITVPASSLGDLAQFITLVSASVN